MKPFLMFAVCTQLFACGALERAALLRRDGRVTGDRGDPFALDGNPWRTRYALGHPDLQAFTILLRSRLHHPARHGFTWVGERMLRIASGNVVRVSWS